MTAAHTPYLNHTPRTEAQARADRAANPIKGRDLRWFDARRVVLDHAAEVDALEQDALGGDK